MFRVSPLLTSPHPILSEQQKYVHQSTTLVYFVFKKLLAVYWGDRISGSVPNPCKRSALTQQLGSQKLCGE